MRIIRSWAVACGLRKVYEKNYEYEGGLFRKGSKRPDFALSYTPASLGVALAKTEDSKGLGARHTINPYFDAKA